MNNASEVFLRLLETGRQITNVAECGFVDEGGLVVGHFCLFCIF